MKYREYKDYLNHIWNHQDIAMFSCGFDTGFIIGGLMVFEAGLVIQTIYHHYKNKKSEKES